MSGTTDRMKQMNGTQLAKIDLMIAGLKDIVRLGRLGKADTDKIRIAIDHAEKGRAYFIEGNMDKSGLNIAIARDFMQDVVRNAKGVV